MIATATAFDLAERVHAAETLRDRYPTTGIDEHGEIVDALLARDGDRAEAPDASASRSHRRILPGPAQTVPTCPAATTKAPPMTAPTTRLPPQRCGYWCRSGMLGGGFPPATIERGIALGADVIAIDGGSTDSGRTTSAPPRPRPPEQQWHATSAPSCPPPTGRDTRDRRLVRYVGHRRRRRLGSRHRRRDRRRGRSDPPGRPYLRRAGPGTLEDLLDEGTDPTRSSRPDPSMPPRCAGAATSSG